MENTTLSMRWCKTCLARRSSPKLIPRHIPQEYFGRPWSSLVKFLSLRFSDTTNTLHLVRQVKVKRREWSLKRGLACANMDDGRWAMDDGRWMRDDGRWIESSVPIDSDSGAINALALCRCSLKVVSVVISTNAVPHSYHFNSSQDE